MHFDENKLMKVAKLVRLKIDNDHVPSLINNIKQIITVLKELQLVNTSGIEPLVNITAGDTPMRKDEVTDKAKPEQIIAGSQYAKYNCFSVPKVIE